MNARPLQARLLISLAAFCASAALAQSLSLPVGDALATFEYDKITLAHAAQTRNKLESSLKDYLVAFNPQFVNERVHVGVPLASFANNRLDFAYDLAGKNVMAQWRLVQPTSYGQRWDYQAYVSGAGTVSFVISARF